MDTEDPAILPILYGKRLVNRLAIGAISKVQITGPAAKLIALSKVSLLK